MSQTVLRHFPAKNPAALRRYIVYCALGVLRRTSDGFLLLFNLAAGTFSSLKSMFKSDEYRITATNTANCILFATLAKDFRRNRHENNA
jgi:hypothetical protein